jgi:hypothetical protein
MDAAGLSVLYGLGEIFVLSNVLYWLNICFDDCGLGGFGSGETGV